MDMNKIGIYLSIIPALIISALIIQCSFQREYCNGMAGGFFIIIKYGGLFLVALATIVIQLLLALKGNEKYHRIIAASICGFLFITGTSSEFISKSMQSKIIFKAEIMGPTLDIGQLKIMENGTYSATYGHIDWSCTIAGKYQRLLDTLILENRVVVESDSIFSEKYLVQDNEFLLPIHQGNHKVGSTHWFKIK